MPAASSLVVLNVFSILLSWKLNVGSTYAHANRLFKIVLPSSSITSKSVASYQSKIQQFSLFSKHTTQTQPTSPHPSCQARPKPSPQQPWSRCPPPSSTRRSRQPSRSSPRRPCCLSCSSGRAPRRGANSWSRSIRSTSMGISMLPLRVVEISYRRLVS